MRSTTYRRAIAALLTFALALGGLPGVAEAQDRPDLKVEDVKLFVGPNGQVNDRVVSFKVTNVGKADATEATGKLEILSPPPAKEEGLKIDKVIAKNGGSAQGFAQLPAPCDGHTVKVTLKAPNETNLGNNTVGPVKLCESKSPPKPPSTQSGGIVVSGPVGEVAVAKPEPPAVAKIDTELVVLPEHKRPGPHDLSLPASAVRAWDRDRNFGDEEVQGECEIIAGLGGPGVRVGWLQTEHEETGLLGIVTSRCAYVAEKQVGVTFDYRDLDDILNMKITRAELTFDERELAWRETDGTARQASGCVAAVGIATEELPPFGPFAAEPYRDVTPGASRRFDVRSAVQQQVWNERPRFGFVVRGSLSIDQLEGVGVSSCMSIIDNIRLEVHYVVEN